MKIVSTLFQGKYSLHTTFLDTTIQIEAIVEEGETAEQVLNQLKSRADKKIEEWRKERQIDLGYGKGVPVPEGLPYGAQPLGIIDLSDEKIEIAIDNADTLEKMDQVKIDYPTMSARRMAYYNAKRKTLTNETI